jgi:hypothetical protein
MIWIAVVLGTVTVAAVALIFAVLLTIETYASDRRDEQ